MLLILDGGTGIFLLGPILIKDDRDLVSRDDWIIGLTCSFKNCFVFMLYAYYRYLLSTCRLWCSQNGLWLFLLFKLNCLSVWCKFLFSFLYHMIVLYWIHFLIEFITQNWRYIFRLARHNVIVNFTCWWFRIARRWFLWRKSFCFRFFWASKGTILTILAILLTFCSFCNPTPLAIYLHYCIWSWSLLYLLNLWLWIGMFISISSS